MLHINGIIQDVVLCVWLLLNMFSRFIHVTASISSSFLFMAEQHSIAWLYHILLIHSSADGHWGDFHLLAIVNSALFTKHWCTSFYVNLGIQLGVELLDHMVTLLNLLRNCQTVSYSGASTLHFHQQYLRVLISPHPRQHL